MPQVERRLAAILLADIEGYSALMEQDESGTFDRVRALREQLVVPTVARYGGRIVKTTGDGFLAEFTSGTAALVCAIDIQRLNQAREVERPEARRIGLRMGINLGDIIIDGDDVSGDGVNVAARLEPIAPVGGICISGAVRDQIRENLDVVFEDLGDQQVKNLSRPIRAYRIHLTDGPRPAGPSVRSAQVTRRRVGIALSGAVMAASGGLVFWQQQKSQSPGPVALSTRADSAGEFARLKIGSALIIGIANYHHHERLDNAGNDAIAVATALRLRNIPVTLKVDVPYQEMDRLVREFLNGSGTSSVKLFFFAGHGWNIAGTNYLFPSDVAPRDDLLAGRGLDKAIAVRRIYAGDLTRKVILIDTHGNEESVPDHVVLSISGSPRHETQDAYIMSDGSTSRNSPYAASLVEMLSQPVDDLPKAFLALGKRVEQKTAGKQIPWVSSSISGAESWSSLQGTSAIR